MANTDLSAALKQLAFAEKVPTPESSKQLTREDPEYLGRLTELELDVFYTEKDRIASVRTTVDVMVDAFLFVLSSVTLLFFAAGVAEFGFGVKFAHLLWPVTVGTVLMLVAPAAAAGLLLWRTHLRFVRSCARAVLRNLAVWLREVQGIDPAVLSDEDLHLIDLYLTTWPESRYNEDLLDAIRAADAA